MVTYSSKGVIHELSLVTEEKEAINERSYQIHWWGPQVGKLQLSWEKHSLPTSDAIQGLS